MFQLTDATLERITFAMEDTANELLIDLETGDFIEKNKYQEENHYANPERYVAPPAWDSRRGFAVLEAFAATITSPPEIKLELNAALRRGKGVFKAFRQALSSDEALSRRFHDFKLRTMRPVIEDWMTSLQEEQRLGKLSEEPEDIGDILASEIEFKINSMEEIPFTLETMLSSFAAESFSALPEALRSWSLSSLYEKTRINKDSCFVSFATVDGIHPLMLSVFTVQTSCALPLCVVEGLFGNKESTMLSLEWPLIDTISAFVAKMGATLVVLEGPFFPSCIPEEALAHGFVLSGTEFYKML